MPGIVFEGCCGSAGVQVIGGKVINPATAYLEAEGERVDPSLGPVEVDAIRVVHEWDTSKRPKPPIDVLFALTGSAVAAARAREDGTLGDIYLVTPEGLDELLQRHRATAAAELSFCGACAWALAQAGIPNPVSS